MYDNCANVTVKYMQPAKIKAAGMHASMSMQNVSAEILTISKFILLSTISNI